MEFFSFKKKSEELGRLQDKMGMINDLSTLLVEELPDSVVSIECDETHFIIKTLPNYNVDLIALLKSKKGNSFNTQCPKG